jgi:hypothetical protein
MLKTKISTILQNLNVKHFVFSAHIKLINPDKSEGF